MLDAGTARGVSFPRMAKAAGRTKQAAPDPAKLLEVARAKLGQDGVIKLSSLGPPALRTELAVQLGAEGFEQTKSVIRRPLSEQLVRALSEGSFIPLSGIVSHVAGATAAEAKKAAMALVGSGDARLVLRGTQQVIVPPNAVVLSKDQLVRFARIAKLVAKAASAKTGVSLLQSDLKEALDEVLPSPGGRAAPARTPSRPPQPGGDGPGPSRQAGGEARDPLGSLLAAVDALREPGTGLSFVPQVVARLRPELGIEAARETLLAAAKAGILELRPEGGINRLSEEELALCPPGPHGTRLSWARRTEVVAG